MKNKFFQLARKLSFKSDYEPHKLGAVIVNRNQVLGVGFNKNKTHPRSQSTYKTLHAELDAVLSSDRKDLKNSDIYVYRETKNGELAESFPCQGCRSMLYSIGIKRIYYTDRTGYKKYEL